MAADFSIRCSESKPKTQSGQNINTSRPVFSCLKAWQNSQFPFLSTRSTILKYAVKRAQRETLEREGERGRGEEGGGLSPPAPTPTAEKMESDIENPTERGGGDNFKIILK